MSSPNTPHDVPACECGSNEGQLNEVGCRWEICPFCGEVAAAGCECIYDHLGLRRRSFPADNGYLADDVYSDGVSESQRAEWNARCAARGRLPYVYAPQMCARCGVLWPDLFVVQDAAWEYYAGPCLRSHIVCQPCFSALRTNIDEHQPRPAWVPAPAEIDEYITAWQNRDRETLKRLDPKKFEPGSTRQICYPPE